MIYTILLIIGIVLVVISIFYIKKNKDEEEKKYDDILKMYSEILEYKTYYSEIIDNFDFLIDSTINKVSSNKSLDYNAEDKTVDKKYSSEINLFNINDKNREENISQKVLELKEIGLNNTEIAQRLDKGVREVDIILKMNENNISVK